MRKLPTIDLPFNDLERNITIHNTSAFIFKYIVSSYLIVHLKAGKRKTSPKIIICQIKSSYYSFMQMASQIETYDLAKTFAAEEVTPYPKNKCRSDTSYMRIKVGFLID